MSEECTHDCSTCSANCDHRAPQHEPPHPRSRIRKVIGVVSGKGGVGKSMTSAMLAVSMHRLGYKVRPFPVCLAYMVPLPATAKPSTPLPAVRAWRS